MVRRRGESSARQGSRRIASDRLWPPVAALIALGSSTTTTTTTSGAVIAVAAPTSTMVVVVIVVVVVVVVVRIIPVQIPATVRRPFSPLFSRTT